MIRVCPSLADRSGACTVSSSFGGSDLIASVRRRHHPHGAVPGALLAAAVLSLVNHQRIAHHERQLRPDARLVAVAHDCSEPQIVPCLRRHGYRAVAVGENSLWGAESPREAVTLWMESPPHRTNILDPEWRTTGVAVDGWRYVQVFAVPAAQGH